MNCTVQQVVQFMYSTRAANGDEAKTKAEIELTWSASTKMNFLRLSGKSTSKKRIL